MTKSNPESFSIVPMDAQHLPEVLEVETLSFSLPWSKELFLNELENPNSRIFLLQIPAGGQVITAGHISIWLVADELHILNIAIHPSFRRRGLGFLLLNHALAYARERRTVSALLEVRETNSAARSLYRKSGFYQVGVRPHYYQDTGESAILMDLALTPAETPLGESREVAIDL
jgi:[ribosomal protein S18]-alanine N-acetyltransferase